MSRPHETKFRVLTDHLADEVEFLNDAARRLEAPQPDLRWEAERLRRRASQFRRVLRGMEGRR